MEALFSIAVGVGLSAACGFRIFVPLLMMNLAARGDHLALAGGFEWIASDAALVVFATATVLEIGAYYLPFLDNLLDLAATPSAVVAGTLVTASQVADMDPLLGWSAAIVAGGGSAGLVQGATTLARQFSAVTTAGFGNPLISTFEAAASIFTTLLAVIAPIFALGLVLVLFFFAFKMILLRRKNPALPA